MAIISSDNGLSHVWRQAIIRTDAGLMPFGLYELNRIFMRLNEKNKVLIQEI